VAEALADRAGQEAPDRVRLPAAGLHQVLEAGAVRAAEQGQHSGLLKRRSGNFLVDFAAVSIVVPAAVGDTRDNPLRPRLAPLAVGFDRGWAVLDVLDLGVLDLGVLDLAMGLGSG